MVERLIAPVSKTGVPKGARRFKSCRFRQKHGALTEGPKVAAWKADGRSDAARRFKSCTLRQFRKHARNQPRSCVSTSAPCGSEVSVLGLQFFSGNLSRVGLAAAALKAAGPRERVCEFESHGSRQIFSARQRAHGAAATHAEQQNVRQFRQYNSVGRVAVPKTLDNHSKRRFL